MANDNSFPIPGFHFRVSIDGFEGYLSFQEVTGLEQTAEIIEYRPSHTRLFTTEKRLGLIKTSPITLKKGVIKAEDEFMQIFDKAIYPEKYFHDSEDAGLSITIELLDEKADVMLYWTVYQAVPSKYTAPTLNSENNSLAIESMTFEHAGFDTWFE